MKKLSLILFIGFLITSSSQAQTKAAPTKSEQIEIQTIGILTAENDELTTSAHERNWAITIQQVTGK